MPAKIILSHRTVTQMSELFCKGVCIPDLMKMFGLSRNKITDTLKQNLGEDAYKDAASKIIAMSGRKSAQKLKGRKQDRTPEWTAKIVEKNKARKGSKASDETRKKISNSLKRSYELGRRGKHSKHSKHSKHWTPEKHRAAMKKAVETKRNNGYYELHSKRHSKWMKLHSPMRGRIHTRETRTKMSEAKKQFFENGGTTWMKGKTHSSETKKKLSKNAKQMWKDKKFGYGNNGLFRSKLEIATFDYIKKLFPNVQHSVPITHNFRTYVFDIFIPNKNLMIEINGDYWHMNPNLYGCDHFDDSRNVTARDVWNQDKCKLNAAAAKGYNIGVIWEHDLNNYGIEQCVSMIIDQTSSTWGRSDRDDTSLLTC